MFRVTNGQRTEQDDINKAEDSSVGADTERQRQHGNGREPGTFPQHSQPVPYVLDKISQPSPSPNFSRDFLHQFHIPKFPPRRALRFLFLLPSLRALSRRHFQMAPHFLVKLCLPSLPPPETHRPPPRFLTSLLHFLALSLLLRLQHARNRVRKLRPLRTLFRQLLLSCGRQLVKFCPLLVFGDSPFRFNPLLFFQAVQRRIQRTGIDLQQLARPIPDRHADPIAVLRSPLQRLQNQQVQRPLQKLNPVLVPLFLLSHCSVPQTIPSMLNQVPRTLLPHRLFAFVSWL